MKNINIKNSLFLVIFISLFTCADDFIDVDSQDENSEDFFNTEADYQSALVAAYDMLQATAEQFQTAEIASDNALCGGQDASDTPGKQEIDDMIHTPVNAQLRNIWTWMFTGVNRANYILEFQNKIDFPNKNSVLAQARFLRAFYYSELVKWFGDVPLAVDKRIQFGEQFSIDRTPKAEIYQVIEQDLIFAAENLPYIQNQTGRITKGAAQALLGKIYLYQNKFPEAGVVLEDLIDKGPHDLLSSTEAKNMFENNYENNIESVFEIQYSDVNGGSYDCFYCLDGNYAVGFNGVRGYEGPIYDFGFSFNVPVQEVVDAFEPGDLRLEYSILDIEKWAANTGATYQEGYEHTGYYNLKYIARKGDLNLPDAALTNPNNFRVIRFADVLLMAAEALNRGGVSDIRAQNYLNRVRQRAFNDNLHNVTTTGSNLTNDIYKERRVEFVGEALRFFDLVRTNTAEGTIPGFSKAKGHELFPIPIEEIELSGNRWAQNPGYPN